MEEKKIELNKEEVYFLDKMVCDVLNILINTNMNEKQQKAYDILRDNVHFKIHEFYDRES